MVMDSIASLDGLLSELQQIHAALDELREYVTGTVKSHLTVDECARTVGRSCYTVRDWIRRGRLRAERVTGTGPRGRLLIPREELRKLIAQGSGGNITPFAALGDFENE
jgi:excisionase family DNA binding protein